MNIIATQKQPPRKNSDSTVSSVEEEIIRGEIRRFEEPVTPSPLNNGSNFVFNTCRDIRIGEITNVTNVYMSNLAQDIKNTAFTLNDKNMTCKDKLSFIFTQQWFWCLMFLAVVAIVLVTMFVIIFGALNKNLEPDLSSLPVTRIIVTHTKSESCYNQTECNKSVLGSNIPYNFLIGNDGSVIEGEGFNFVKRNSKSFGSIFNGLVIAFIGTYVDEPLSQLQIEIFNGFLQKSIRQDLIDKDVILLLADQLVSSESFANGLYGMLMNRTDFYELEKIFFRAEWGAVPPNAPTKVTHIPKVVQRDPPIFSYDSCSSLDSCNPVILAKQDNHRQKFSNINFNFMISQFGIFEGRGWDWKPEQKIVDEFPPVDLMFYLFVGETPTAGTEDYKKFQNELMTKLNKFIEDGIIIGKIESDYELGCRKTFC